MKYLTFILLLVLTACSHVVTEQEQAVDLYYVIVPPFLTDSATPESSVAETIRTDLSRVTEFRVVSDGALLPIRNTDEKRNRDHIKTLVVTGKVKSLDEEFSEVEFRLYDVTAEQTFLMGKRYKIPESGLHKLAHQISDLIYETTLKEKGVFSSRLIYAAEEKQDDAPSLHVLHVADVNGAHSQKVLQSEHILTAPSWSPDGKLIAYVSFENGMSELFIQELSTGNRSALLQREGIQDPAWSPDGKKLVLSLSENGYPEIYVLTLATGKLSRVTHNSQASDTEPVWLPNGREIVFTSDLSGHPQIYKVDAGGGATERLTFEGDYNASADISPDGRYMAMVHAEENKFRIAVQDLTAGTMRVLTDSSSDKSPTFAPNGRMILYATNNQEGKGVLASVSVDGHIKQRLDDSGLDVREPAWSPFRQ